jgi:hypothetical protein
MTIHASPCRPSSQARPAPPERIPGTCSGSDAPCARAVVMSEAIREILFRDGSVTDAALICEGFTAAEIVEHFDEACRMARLVLTTTGSRADGIADVIAKATDAIASRMPVVAGAPVTDALREAWHRYCRARAAYRLDPWIGQSARSIAALADFLTMQPILPRECNRVIVPVAALLKRIAAQPRPGQGIGNDAGNVTAGARGDDPAN